jgi:hypothetical protein
MSHLSLNSNYSHYILWFVVLFTLFIITLHAFTTETYGSVALIVSILLLLFTARLLNKWA